MIDVVNDGLNGPSAQFRMVGAWPASTGLGGTAGAFNTAVYNPGHSGNPGFTAKTMAQKGMDTSPYSYTALS